MQILGQQASRQFPDLKVEVLPSLGTSGGIKAMAQDAIQIAVAARRIKPEEAASGMVEGACMMTAMVFVTSRDGPPSLRLDQLPAIYHDQAPNWPDGMPLNIVLRSRAGSENSYLSSRIPGLAEALEAAFHRRDVPVTATDQDNVRTARQVAGSLAPATLLQIMSEQPDLRIVPLDNLQPSAETLTSGIWPLPMSICLLLPAKPSAPAARFIDFVTSEAGRRTLHSLGAIPVETRTAAP